MRALLAIALLPACFIAPDRPVEMLPPGTPLTIIPAGCLDDHHPLDPGFVGRLPSGRDALFRTEWDGVHAPRVYEIAFDGPQNCYALAFDVPSALGPVAAMELSLVGGEVLLAIMTEERPGALFVEVALDGATGSVLSTTPTAITLAPQIVTSDDLAYAPRFLRRMPLTHELWFGSTSASGGMAQLGIVAETTPGMLGAAAVHPVHQNGADNEVWLDAFPLATIALDGSTAVLEGEAETCGASEATGAVDVGCDPTLLRPNSGCSMKAERCPSRGTHILAGGSPIVGYSDTQPDTDYVVEMITADAQAQIASLGVPTISSIPYEFADDIALVAVGNRIDAIALWYLDAVGTEAALAYYQGISARSGIAPIATRALTTSPTDLRTGSFTADAPQILAIGASAGDVACFAGDGTFDNCTPW